MLRLESLPGQENMILLLQFYSLCTGYLLSSVSVTKYSQNSGLLVVPRIAKSTKGGIFGSQTLE